MFCPACGKEITEGQLFCSQCGAKIGETQASGGREKTPWEDRSAQGFIASLLKTLRESLFNPTAFFRKMPLSGGMTDPLLYALITGMIGMFFSYLWNILLQGMLQSYLPAAFKTMPGEDMFQTVGLAVVAIIAPFLIIIGLFIWAGILHLFLMMVRGAQAGFEATFRVASYSYGPAVLYIIPFCGGIISFIWSIVLVIIGLKEAHSTSGGKAAFAAITPIVLCCGIAVVILLMMGMAAATMGGMKP